MLQRNTHIANKTIAAKEVNNGYENSTTHHLDDINRIIDFESRLGLGIDTKPQV